MDYAFAPTHCEDEQDMQDLYYLLDGVSACDQSAAALASAAAAFLPAASAQPALMGLPCAIPGMIPVPMGMPCLNVKHEALPTSDSHSQQAQQQQQAPPHLQLQHATSDTSSMGSPFTAGPHSDFSPLRSDPNCGSSSELPSCPTAEAYGIKVEQGVEPQVCGMAQVYGMQQADGCGSDEAGEQAEEEEDQGVHASGPCELVHQQKQQHPVPTLAACGSGGTYASGAATAAFDLPQSSDSTGMPYDSPRYGGGGGSGAKGRAFGRGPSKKMPMSHSTIEKHRRDRINHLIEELGGMVPPVDPRYQGDGGEAAGLKRPKHAILADVVTTYRQLQRDNAALHRLLQQAGVQQQQQPHAAAGAQGQAAAGAPGAKPQRAGSAGVDAAAAAQQRAASVAATAAASAAAALQQQQALVQAQAQGSSAAAAATAAPCAVRAGSNAAAAAALQQAAAAINPLLINSPLFKAAAAAAAAGMPLGSLVPAPLPPSAPSAAAAGCPAALSPTAPCSPAAALPASVTLPAPGLGPMDATPAGFVPVAAGPAVPTPADAPAPAPAAADELSTEVCVQPGTTAPPAGGSTWAVRVRCPARKDLVLSTCNALACANMHLLAVNVRSGGAAGCMSLELEVCCEDGSLPRGLQVGNIQCAVHSVLQGAAPGALAASAPGAGGARAGGSGGGSAKAEGGRKRARA